MDTWAHFVPFFSLQIRYDKMFLKNKYDIILKVSYIIQI